MIKAWQIMLVVKQRSLFYSSEGCLMDVLNWTSIIHQTLKKWMQISTMIFRLISNPAQWNSKIDL